MTLRPLDFAGASWSEAWSELGAEPAAGVLPSLVRSYSQRHRAYHDLRHVAECLERLGSARALAERPAEVTLAIWFHDAVYLPWRRDNEARSARWAREALLEARAGEAAAGRVADAVLATGDHGAASTPDVALLLDVDLGILGASPERFDEYEEQVRAEYRWVPERLFRARRRKLLESLLARPRLYQTEWFRERLEGAALGNLRRSLARLGS